MFIALSVVAVVLLFLGAALGGRLYLLRPSATQAFRAQPQRPLDAGELSRLAAWARRGPRLFALYWVLFALLMSMVAVSLVPPQTLLVLAALGILAGAWHSASARCPRCHYPLGLEPGGFRVPALCPRCRVVCNPLSSFAALARALGQTNEGEDMITGSVDGSRRPQ